MPSIADYIKQLQAGQASANAANEKRYQAGMKELRSGQTAMQGLYDKAGVDIASLGETARLDTNIAADRAQAQGQQGLISSGLFNTTMGANLSRGVESDRARQLGRISESQAGQRAGLATQRAGAEMGASGGISDFIAGRYDTGPDPGIYAGLIQAAAAGENNRPINVYGGMGPNASAGLDAFGNTPRYGPSISRGGGGGGGGFTPSGGAGAGGGNTPAGQAQYFGPGTGTAAPGSNTGDLIIMPAGSGQISQAAQPTQAPGKRVSIYDPRFSALSKAGKLKKKQFGYYTT